MNVDTDFAVLVAQAKDHGMPHVKLPIEMAEAVLQRLQHGDPLGLSMLVEDQRIAIDSRDRLLLAVMRAIGPEAAQAPRDEWPALIEALKVGHVHSDTSAKLELDR